MAGPPSAPSSRAAGAESCLPCRAADQPAHHSGSLYAGGALQATLPAAGSCLYSFVSDGNAFPSSTSTPFGAGVATYFSSAGRYFVTNGSAFSTTTSRSGHKNGTVDSSSATPA